MSLTMLHGWRDHPTDGIDNNSAMLASALEALGVRVRRVDLPWDQVGWRAVRSRAREIGASAGGGWVLLPFTPLMWSRKGLPLRVLSVVRRLRRGGAQVAVHFHDVLPASGPRVRDRFRTFVQRWTMRRLTRGADAVLSSVHPSLVPWMSEADRRRAILLVTGSAVPSATMRAMRRRGHLRVVVFGLTDRRESRESAEIAELMILLADAGVQVRLDLIGRGSEVSGSVIEPALADHDVEVAVHGLLTAEEISRALAGSDVMLFLRTGVSSRRSTVAAGIAHALPIAGYRSPETGPPVTDAGLALVDQGDLQGLAHILIRMSRDPSELAILSERSRIAFERTFSWPAIAGALFEGLWGPRSSHG